MLWSTRRDTNNLRLLKPGSARFTHFPRSPTVSAEPSLPPLVASRPFPPTRPLSILQPTPIGRPFLGFFEPACARFCFRDPSQPVLTCRFHHASQSVYVQQQRHPSCPPKFASMPLIALLVLPPFNPSIRFSPKLMMAVGAPLNRVAFVTAFRTPFASKKNYDGTRSNGIESSPSYSDVVVVVVVVFFPLPRAAQPSPPTTSTVGLSLHLTVLTSASRGASCSCRRPTTPDWFMACLGGGNLRLCPPSTLSP